MTARLDLSIQTLGPGEVPSPVSGTNFVPDRERLLLPLDLETVSKHYASGEIPPAFELAGAREKLFFRPDKTKAGIVTCGGLCPGLNAVIRSVVMGLWYQYGVTKIVGFRYGYAGLSSKFGHEPMELTPKVVDEIHHAGGTILGTSRGPQDVGDMLATLERHGVNLLFALGGDGTLRGAGDIAQEAMRRKLPIAVVGIPKTIDNDISLIQTSFGFQTAAAAALEVLVGAHTEALAAENGIGLVRLMGRDSGFITGWASVASGDVNFCLVPEVPFTLPGFLSALEQRLKKRGHALIAVAEGAGQDLISGDKARDASGNVLHQDIGLFLKNAIQQHFKGKGLPATIRYFDPSYSIRAVPANAWDLAFTWLLGQNAVHAGMSGRTNLLVGYWGAQFTHVPIHAATAERKKIDPAGWMWSSVLASTGQPPRM
jgi:6-phosphofructokinase 1